MTYDHPFSKTDHETIDSTRILVIGEIRNSPGGLRLRRRPQAPRPAQIRPRPRAPPPTRSTQARATLRAHLPAIPALAAAESPTGATCAPQRRRSQRCVIARLHPGQPSPRLPDTQKYPQKLGSLYCTYGIWFYITKNEP
jgi:hypothetical protein